MEKIVFETNVAQTLALKYPTGKTVKSQIDGSDQVMYTCTDGRVMFHYPSTAEKIDSLCLKPGENFVMCRKEVRNGGGKPKIEWQVEPEQPRDVTPTAAPASSVSTQTVPSGLSRSQNTPPTLVPIDKAIYQFLIVAGRAKQAAERELGFPIDQVTQDLATSLFIHAGRANWLTWIAPETAAAPITLPPDVPPNTKAASEFVAGQKIATLQAQAKPAASAEFPSKRGDIKAAFAKAREAVGETRYQEELEALKIRDPLELTYLDRMREFWKHLMDVADQQEVA